MREYKTISGDTWDKIAFTQLGDEKLAVKLIETNIKHVETVIFPAGVILVIPDIAVDSTSSNLPPWKRGGS
jgi:phage tail protein X